MSKIAKLPIVVPENNTVSLENNVVHIKGPNGEISTSINKDVLIKYDTTTGQLTVSPANSNDRQSWAQAGTARANLNNAVKGVNEGFKINLDLVGVGYRAQMQGNKLILSLGFSHPIEFHPPHGVKIETPNNTTIILHSSNKQLLGQVASNIREFRKPEPYKGKGIIRNGEKIIRKEAKKK